jgi:hypothetical protein
MAKGKDKDKDSGGPIDKDSIAEEKKAKADREEAALKYGTLLQTVFPKVDNPPDPNAAKGGENLEAFSGILQMLSSAFGGAGGAGGAGGQGTTSQGFGSMGGGEGLGYKKGGSIKKGTKKSTKKIARKSTKKIARKSVKKRAALRGQRSELRGS